MLLWRRGERGAIGRPCTGELAPASDASAEATRETAGWPGPARKLSEPVWREHKPHMAATSN